MIKIDPVFDFDGYVKDVRRFDNASKYIMNEEPVKEVFLYLTSNSAPLRAPKNPQSKIPVRPVFYFYPSLTC